MLLVRKQKHPSMYIQVFNAKQKEKLITQTDIVPQFPTPSENIMNSLHKHIKLFFCSYKNTMIWLYILHIFIGGTYVHPKLILPAAVDINVRDGHQWQDYYSKHWYQSHHGNHVKFYNKSKMNWSQSCNESSVALTDRAKCLERRSLGSRQLVPHCGMKTISLFHLCHSDIILIIIWPLTSEFINQLEGILWCSNKYP